MSTPSPTAGIDATTSTVFVDPHTRLFHRQDRHAGADALAFSRPQAAVFGYRPCPDCYTARRPDREHAAASDDLDADAGGSSI